MALWCDDTSDLPQKNVVIVVAGERPEDVNDAVIVFVAEVLLLNIFSKESACALMFFH